MHPTSYAEAEQLEKRALVIREKAPGPDHRRVAAWIDKVADLYTDQRRYADAEPLCKRSLMIGEKAFGPDHPAAAQSHNLADLYRLPSHHADVSPLVQTTIGRLGEG